MRSVGFFIGAFMIGAFFLGPIEHTLIKGGMAIILSIVFGGMFAATDSEYEKQFKVRVQLKKRDQHNTIDTDN